MHIKTFEDVIAWQKAKELHLLLMQDMAACKDFSYKDQLLRASLSISNNIAEDFDRGSNKELRQFLIIARGSAAEVRSMLLIGAEVQYFVDPDIRQRLVKDTSRLLTGFIKSLEPN